MTSNTAPFVGPVSRDDIVRRIEAHPLGDDADEQRVRFARLVLGDGAGDRRDDDGGDIHVGHGDVKPSKDRGTVVYFHGGGYAFGSPSTHARIGRGLFERTGFDVVLPRYPLAPEHRWPSQLEASLASVDAVAGSVVLAGDSAGGHLAIVTALELVRRGRSVAGLVLFSPNTDRSGLSDTRSRNDPVDPMVDDVGDRELAEQCFVGLATDHPHVSPVLDDLSLLPPVHLEFGVDEVLAGDGRVLASRARTAGCDVDVYEDPDGLHMGQLWAPWWRPAVTSLDRAARFIRSISE